MWYDLDDLRGYFSELKRFQKSIDHRQSDVLALVKGSMRAITSSRELMREVDRRLASDGSAMMKPPHRG